MQELFGLPPDEWAWINYQLELPETCPQYECKALSAGAVAIALEIIKTKLNGHLSPKKALDEYEKRVTKIFEAFEKEFGKTACQALLGFDAMKYDDYPPEKQEYIEGGEWMKDCCRYMEFVVKKMCEDRQDCENVQEGR
jgi:hypothetical protein